MVLRIHYTLLENSSCSNDLKIHNPQILNISLSLLKEKLDIVAYIILNFNLTFWLGSCTLKSLHIINSVTI